MKPGTQVKIIGDHPWSGEIGRTVAFESYGPKSFGWKAWRVALSDGMECYAKPHELKVI